MTTVKKPTLDKSKPPIEYIFAKDYTFPCIVADIDLYTTDEIRNMESFHPVGEDPSEAFARPRLRYLNINTMTEVFRNGGMPIFRYEDYPRIYEIHVRIFDYLTVMQERKAAKNSKLPLDDLRLLNEFDKRLCELIPEYLIDERLDLRMTDMGGFGGVFLTEEEQQAHGIVPEERGKPKRVDFTSTFGELDWMNV